MSSNIDPPKNIDLSSYSFDPQNSLQKSFSNQKAENSAITIIETKNVKDNNSQNELDILDKNKEIKFLENKVDKKEIMVQEKESEDIIMMEDKNNNEENKINEFEIHLKNKLNELKDLSNNELRQCCQEYYLISRDWMIKLNDYIKGINDIKLEQLKGKKDNDEFLLEKEKINRALSINQDKDKMIILKPQYAFAVTQKPCPVNKTFWDFITKYFRLEPEVKEYAEPIKEEDGTISYKRDYCKYVKINCIILPKKRNYKNEIFNSFNDYYTNPNVNWPIPNDYIKGLIKDIQNFYFFSRKDISVKDLLDTVEDIVRKYPDIKLVDRSDYRCWIDLNYYEFENLLNLIKEKISDIYNIYNINPSSYLDLNVLEEEEERDAQNEIPGRNRFFFKLFPLKLFENEELTEIFPNQFTDNFDIINRTQLAFRNEKLKIRECPKEIFDKVQCFNKFPELTIIIEQGIDSLFFKDESKIKYEIKACNYRPCSRRGILAVSCECLKKYYCSYKCKNDDKKFHEDECQYSLTNYFMTMSQQICKAVMKESSIGLKGIRNIGNTCYMSTALQCISNCVELRNYFLFGSPRKDVNKNNVLGYKGLVAYGFEYLIKKLWVDDDPVIDLGKFKRAMGLCNERFGGRSQQDTHEFVTFLIDSLHEDLNRVNNKIYIAKEERDLSDEIKSKIEWNNYLRRNQSILVDLFYGLFKSTVSCSICNRSCVDFNTFSSISVNLKNTNSKKQNTTDINKENKLAFAVQNNGNDINDKMEIENNNEKEKDNIINNNSQDIKMKCEENINNNSNNEIPCKKALMEVSDSTNKKQEVLVGGKPNESDTFSEKKNENDFNVKIPLIFYFYTLDEKPIQFGLTLKDKKELSHKSLLYKISQILNKDPYSLCLYHISNSDKNINDIYGQNNFSVYGSNNLDNKILFISEINRDIIRNNLTNDTNMIFYDANIHKYHLDKKNTSREILEYNLNKNKENIKKVINNIITEKDLENLDIKYLSNYHMNLDKVFQFTLKNFIIETKDKPPKIISYPRVLFFSKNINIIDLYFEIFKINKKVICDQPTDKLEQIKQLFLQLFQIASNTDKKNFKFEEVPYFLCVKIYDNKKNKFGTQNILFLSQDEQNKKIQDILIGMDYQPNECDIQIIIEIYWNEKYNEKLINCLRPEKIDKLIEPEKEIKDKNQKLNESIDSTTKSSRGSNIEDIQKLQKERYNNLYEKYSILNCAPTNINSNNNTNTVIENKPDNIIDNTIETQINENSSKTPQTEASSPLSIPSVPEVIKNEISLDETFEILSEEELLDENNEWYCENCKKKQRAKKKLEIYNTPKILIIQIKRFSHINKINTKVDFPLKDLDLSKYILSKDKIRPTKYDLFAVANHYGSLSFGHYTAFCKNSINEKWYEFNDSSVCEITDLTKIISSNAYVLFYRQKGLSKLNWKEIYKKPFIKIDINNPDTLVDYNDDFINHINHNKIIETDGDDINEFDKKIRETITKIDENKNMENINRNDNDTKINENKSHDFLNKKRLSPDKI